MKRKKITFEPLDERTIDGLYFVSNGVEENGFFDEEEDGTVPLSGAEPDESGQSPDKWNEEHEAEIREMLRTSSSMEGLAGIVYAQDDDDPPEELERRK